MKKGKLIVISGPSGVGKGTVIKGLIARDPRLKLSVSATTREKRPSETNGVQYFFVTREEFHRMIEEKKFLEYAPYVDNLYGTPEEPVDRMLEEGWNVVLEIEVKGGLQVMHRRPDAICIFLAAPSFEVLEQRLRGRGDTDEDKIRQRIETAKEEYRIAPQYGYIVVNGLLEDALDDVADILRSEELKAQNQLDVVAVDD